MSGAITHLILFRPRPDLSAADRDGLVSAIERALREIPGIAASRVGTRLTLGREYDARNAQDFPFAAVLEFESEADLRTYLDHPAHRDLGQRFYQTAEAALAFDFVLRDAAEVRDLLRG